MGNTVAIRARAVLAVFTLLGCRYAMAESVAPVSVSAPALSLDQAVDESVHHNLDLLAAQYSVPLARADELTAGLWENPALLADTAFEPFASNWNQTNAGGPRQFDVGLSVPLDLSGKHGAAVESAKAATRLAELGLLDTVRQKVLQVRQGYIDVVTKQNQVSLAVEKMEGYEKLVHIIENRIGQKPVRPLLLVRAELARDQARLDLRQRQADLSSAKTMLAILLGRAPSEDAFQAVTQLRDFSLEGIPEKESVETQALESRPDLLALEQAVAKADLDRRLATDQIWDDFNVSFSLSSQGPVDANPNLPGSTAVPAGYSWDGAVTIPMPVFNRNQGNINKADLTKAQTQKEVESLTLSIRQEIGDELERLKIDHDLILDYESSQIKNARQVRDSQQTLFGTGYIALLDYFDAMEAYDGVLSSYYDTLGDYRKTAAQLNASVGEEVMP
jgi:cobalt-zinc-cadmium efflux system outer membrane protein